MVGLSKHPGHDPFAGECSCDRPKGQDLTYGKISFWIGRGLTWAGRILQPVNFIMLFYLTIQEQPLAWLLLPVCICAGVLFLQMDNKHVLEKESEYQFYKSPPGVEMLENTRATKKMLEEMKHGK